MDNNSKIFLLKAAVATFLYSISIMLAYQFWIIEYMSDTAVNGLLAGDPQYYHGLAVDMREKIIREGWGAWYLRPAGHGPAGVLSILYYLIGPYPLLVVIINGLCHALAAIFLILILSRVISLRYALGASLFFIVSPFEMHWLSQVNKGSFVTLGVFVFVYGVVRFGERKNYFELVSFVWMYAGVAIISISRPYVVQIIFVATVILGLFIMLFAIRRNDLRIGGFALFVFPILFIPLMFGANSDQRISSITYEDAEMSSDLIKNKYSNWTKSNYLPGIIDQKLFALSFSRLPYEDLKNSPNATVRALDLTDDAEFHSARDIFLYLPRAMQIALFAPFPNSWPLFSNINDRSTFRLMVSAEMFVAYVAFIFLIHGLLRYKHIKIYLPVYYMLFVLQVYGIAIPHAGIIYRYRYSYFILLISLGLAFLINFWIGKNNQILCINDDKEF